MIEDEKCMQRYWIILLSTLAWVMISPAPSIADPNPSPRPSQKRQSKGRLPREKEAEGTQAPNRFDADMVTKSQYEYHGQPLEVDTD
jgi:hypothetical protein